MVSIREWLDFATERVPQLQEEKLKSRDIKLQAGDNEGMQKHNTIEAQSTDVQSPRVFYRREAEPEPFIVARP